MDDDMTPLPESPAFPSPMNQKETGLTRREYAEVHVFAALAAESPDEAPNDLAERTESLINGLMLLWETRDY